GYTGQPDGNTGVGGIQAFTAGQTFDVTVNLVDAYFNQSETLDTFVKLSANDPFANPAISALPQQQTGPANGFPIGQTVFTNIVLITRNPAGWQILSSTSTGDPYATAVSTWIPVQSNTAQKLLVLAPGEFNQEGNPIGKQGSPSGPFTVG